MKTTGCRPVAFAFSICSPSYLEIVAMSGPLFVCGPARPSVSRPGHHHSTLRCLPPTPFDAARRSGLAADHHAPQPDHLHLGLRRAHGDLLRLVAQGAPQRDERQAADHGGHPQGDRAVREHGPGG